MTDIELAGVVILVVLLLVLPADLALLRSAPAATSAGPQARCLALDWPCRHDKSSAECPERQGGACDE